MDASEGKIPGVGRDEPIITDEKGYKTSKTPYRCDLLPGAAMLHLSHIMEYGARGHGEDNWRKGNVRDHLNKMLVHVFAYLDGDEQDDHLGHAAWRAMAALEIHIHNGRELAQTIGAGSREPVKLLTWDSVSHPRKKEIFDKLTAESDQSVKDVVNQSHLDVARKVVAEDAEIISALKDREEKEHDRKASSERELVELGIPAGWLNFRRTDSVDDDLSRTGPEHFVTARTETRCIR